mmetsp:Transcript_64185/g.165748  ORF Transcript_64185/g.165748 Transcript_64185/m.165748 type:complete len:396 (+) Transcript_64185:526-1713(+)
MARLVRIHLVRGCAPDTGIHCVQGVRLLPAVLHLLRCLVLCAVAMLGGQLAAEVLDGVLYRIPGRVHVDVPGEDEVLVVDVAAEVRVDPTALDGELLLRQHWVLLEILGQGVVDGQAREPHSDAVRPEGRRDHEAPQIRPVGLLALQDLVLHIALGLVGNELLKSVSETVDLSIGILTQLHEHVVPVVPAEVPQLLRQGVRDDVVEPIQELVTNDVREGQWDHLDREFQVPQRLETLHAHELNHFDEDPACPVDAVVDLAVHVLASLGHAVGSLQGNLALEGVSVGEVLASHPNQLALLRNGVGVVHGGQYQDLALRPAALQACGVGIEARDRALVEGADHASVIRPRTRACALRIHVLGLQLRPGVQKTDRIPAVPQAEGVHQLDAAVVFNLQE